MAPPMPGRFYAPPEDLCAAARDARARVEGAIAKSLVLQHTAQVLRQVSWQRPQDGEPLGLTASDAEPAED
jgi:hypothetical protein